MQRPYLSDGDAKLLIGLVHFVSCFVRKISIDKARFTNQVHLTRSHFDAEILADESEQRRSEVHLAISVHGHVHSNKFFVRQTVRALVAEAERRVHVLQHVEHLRVQYFAAVEEK